MKVNSGFDLVLIFIGLYSVSHLQRVPNGQNTTGKDSEKVVILNMSYHFFGDNED